MRKRSRFRYYIVAVLLVLLVVGICLEIFEPGTVGDVTPFIVSMISLLVAVLAFDISLRTYTSIDAVVWKDYMNRAVISFIQKDDFKLLSAPFRQIVNYVS